MNRGLINSLLIGVFLIFSAVLDAQTDKNYIRQGNREYGNNNFSESEVAYRKAIDKNKQSPDAVFNIGDALYKQNKFEDAGRQFIENTNMNEDYKKKSAGLYNLGNSLLMADKVKESIEAYKGSLKLYPDSKEAKYNLAYAQDLLKQQEKEQQQDQDKQDRNKDNKKEDQNKDQKDQKDQNDQNEKGNEQQREQEGDQEKQQGISREDAQRLLNALANDEKDIQEKVKLAKAAKAKVRTVKNW